MNYIRMDVCNHQINFYGGGKQHGTVRIEIVSMLLEQERVQRKHLKINAAMLMYSMFRLKIGRNVLYSCNGDTQRKM